MSGPDHPDAPVKIGVRIGVRIGARLKHARLVKGLSLSEVAKTIGVTEGYISKLENDRSQASLATLHKLVKALGKNMGDLFAADREEDGPVLVLRNGDRPLLATGHRRAGDQVVLERLVPGGAGRLLQINIHIVAPGGGSPEPISHAGQEFGYVLTGALDLIVDGRAIPLDAGDAFSFDSPLPHHYRNVGKQEARVLWVNTPPTF